MDAHFNASVIVTHGVGFWVNHVNLLEELQNALKAIDKWVYFFIQLFFKLIKIDLYKI